MSAAPAGPIFVVGCQRSGTTLMRLLLDSHSRISCGAETLFLSDMERIVTSDWSRMARFGFSQQYWLDRIADFFGGMQREYAANRGKQRWADKSPEYAMHIDFIGRVFPDAQFIHVIRDGRDVAVSHRKRFGYWACVKSAVKWPRYIAAARASASKLEPGRYYEVRYHELVGDLEQTMKRVFAFLGEEWEPQILEYDKQPHDVADRYLNQVTSRRAAAKKPAAVYNSRVGSYRQELDPMVRTLFWLTSRSTLKELGYS